MKNDKKRMYTNADLFYIILDRLKKKDLLPPILDYSLGAADIVKIKDISWDAIGRITFGSSEGIYLRIYIEGVISDGYDKAELGTFKTLEASKDAYKIMSDLNVEFIFELKDFVEENIDSFYWTGYTVEFFMDGKSQGEMTVSRKDRAINAIKKYMARHYRAEYATITNNETDVVEIVKRKDLQID